MKTIRHDPVQRSCSRCWIAWIGIKGVVHWQVFKDDFANPKIAFSFIGVLGTMVSLLVAIACGVYLKHLA